MTHREMTAQEARQHWAALVAGAEHRNETTIITRYGRPVAVVGPIGLIRQEDTMTGTTSIDRERIPGNPATAVFMSAPTGHEVPWRYQLYLIDGGRRIPVDYPRELRRWPAQFELSAELLGVDPGTRFEIDILAWHAPAAGEQVTRTVPVTAERLGVISGEEAQSLPVGTEIQNIRNRGPLGRRRRDADGWVCDAAPAGGDPSWHTVGTGPELEWRIISETTGR